MTTVECLFGWQAIDAAKLLQESGYKAQVRRRASPDVGPGLNGWFILSDADKETVASHVTEVSTIA